MDGYLKFGVIDEEKLKEGIEEIKYTFNCKIPRLNFKIKIPNPWFLIKFLYNGTFLCLWENSLS